VISSSADAMVDAELAPSRVDLAASSALGRVCGVKLIFTAVADESV